MGEGRPEGLHLGDIIRARKIALGESVKSPEGDQPNVRVCEGFLWETAVEYMLAGVSRDEAIDLAFKRYCMQIREGVVRQVRLERDGVHMTPDAFDPATGRLESYKATRRTLNNARTWELFSEHFWSWVWQEMSYCLAARVDSVRWIVLWQAGDYSKGWGSGPQVLEATATWTEEELAAQWREVLQFAKQSGLRKR